MKEKYILLLDKKILKGKRLFKSYMPEDSLNAPRLGVKKLRLSENDLIGSDIEIVSTKLSLKEIAKLNRADSAVIDYAKALPIQLIAPIVCEKVKNIDTNLNWNINAVYSPQSEYTGKGITCAVLDTGIYRDSEAFNGLNIIEKDFTGEGNKDIDGHGTHCAGIFFGRNIVGQKIGIASGVTKALIGKVISSKNSDTSMLINGIDWAIKNGANIISMSIGMDYPGYVENLIKEFKMPLKLATSKALYEYRNTINLFETYFSYINTQCKRGELQPVVMVSAAGNESRRDLDKRFKINLSPPALIDGVISVSALEKVINGFQTAYFSNIGATLSAPGVDIISASIDGGTVLMSGTSMATPHVAGCAALWAEKLLETNSFTHQNLLSNLIVSSNKENILNWNIEDHGVGLVQGPI